MARSVGVDRARVLEVATKLADEVGLENLALAQVAEQLGIKLPSLYNHVAGLAGLRRELALLGGRQLADRLARAAIGKSEDAAVFAVAQAYRAFVLEHPGLYAGLVRAPAADDQELSQVGQALVDVVLLVLEPYYLGERGAIHAVRGLRSIVHGFATLERAGGFGMPLDRDESFARLLRAYVAGLRAENARS
jgi:AcrR family transcriptional regulator